MYHVHSLAGIRGSCHSCAANRTSKSHLLALGRNLVPIHVDHDAPGKLDRESSPDILLVEGIRSEHCNRAGSRGVLRQGFLRGPPRLKRLPAGRYVKGAGDILGVKEVEGRAAVDVVHVHVESRGLAARPLHEIPFREALAHVYHECARLAAWLKVGRFVVLQPATEPGSADGASRLLLQPFELGPPIRERFTFGSSGMKKGGGWHGDISGVDDLGFDGLSVADLLEGGGDAGYACQGGEEGGEAHLCG